MSGRCPQSWQLHQNGATVPRGNRAGMFSHYRFTINMGTAAICRNLGLSVSFRSSSKSWLCLPDGRARRMAIKLVSNPNWYGLIFSYGFGPSFSKASGLSTSSVLVTELQTYAGSQTKLLYYHDFPCRFNMWLAIVYNKVPSPVSGSTIQMIMAHRPSVRICVCPIYLLLYV